MKVIIPVFDHAGLRPALAIQKSFDACDVSTIAVDFSNSEEFLLTDWPLPALKGEFEVQGSQKKFRKVSVKKAVLKKISEKIQDYYNAGGMNPQELRSNSISQNAETSCAAALPHEFFEADLRRFKKISTPVSDRIKHDLHTVDIVARHWLADFLSLTEETFAKRARVATTRLLGAITDAVKFDLKRKNISRFLEENAVTHGVFTNLSLIQALPVRAALSDTECQVAIVHDSYMPPEQLKAIHLTFERGCEPIEATRIRYGFQDGIAALDHTNTRGSVAVRIPERNSRILEVARVLPHHPWDSVPEFNNEIVVTKGRRVFEKLKDQKDNVDWLYCGENPMLESDGVVPIDISEGNLNVLVNVAPDIFSSSRFSFTEFVTSMEAYVDALSEILRKLPDSANIILSPHPRLPKNSPTLQPLLEFGSVIKSGTLDVLPFADLFVTYVGSVTNLDAETCHIPMIALSLYDGAVTYDQNDFDLIDFSCISSWQQLRDLKLDNIEPSKFAPLHLCRGSSAENIINKWSQSSEEFERTKKVGLWAYVSSFFRSGRPAVR